MENIITGYNIVKTFNKDEKINILDGVNIGIRKGDFTVVMGPSGCGKTTLLFVLSGTDDINSGTILFDETELSELTENQLDDLRKTKMGFIFKKTTMLKNLKLFDNIILPSSLYKQKSTTEIIDKAKKLMSKVGIAGLEKSNITDVSGEQLQRADICRAFMGSPDILFADEPTGALNFKMADEIMDLLSDINENGTTIFLTTHDAKVAAKANRILFMKDGTIKSELCFNKLSSMSTEEKIQKIIIKMREMEI